MISLINLNRIAFLRRNGTVLVVKYAHEFSTHNFKNNYYEKNLISTSIIDHFM